MPLLYTPDLLFEGFSLSRAVLLDSEGNEQPDGEIYGVRSAVWEPEIESYDEFSHEKLINVWSDVRRVNFTMEAGYTSMSIWSKLLGSSVTSQSLITNLLTANQASGTDTLGDTTGFTPSLGTAASSNSYYKSGARSVSLTSNSAGMCYLVIPSVGAEEGQTVTYQMWVRGVGGSVGRQAGLYVDAVGDSGWLWGSHLTTVNLTSSWQLLYSSLTYPTGYGITNAGIVLRLDAGAGSQVVYADEIGYWKGTGGIWAMPGEPILGLTDSPANWQDSLPLWEHGSGNAQALPVRLTFPAKDAAGNMQDLSLTLFKVKFKPPKSSGASYKDGQSVSYEATALLSATDETGAVLEREAFGRIDRAYSVG